MEPWTLPAYPSGKKELVFGAAILCGSLLMANTVLYGGFHLGFSIAAVICILCAGIYLLCSGCKLKAYPAALLVLSLVISASFARSDDAFVKLVMLCFLFVGINLGLSLLAGKNRFHPGGAASVLDAFCAFFGQGFGELPPVTRGIGTALRGGGTLLKKGSAILLGFGIAVPLLLIIVPLLTQADAAFEGLLAQLPEISIASILSTAVLGSLLALVLYAQGVALRHAPAPLKRTSIPHRGLPTATVNTVLGAVCFVYCVYLASQLAYLAGGFSGVLPEGYTLAQYARRGFFEMAWLCAINLVIFISSLALCGKKAPSPKSTRLLCLFIGIVTLFLVSTASAKMLLYIGSFGLTRLRVLTQIIIVFLGLVTVLVCLWLFLPKLPYMKAVILVALAIGAAVSWMDVDTQVARYNVTAYLDGRMESVDVHYLSSLGNGAVPYILQLSQEAPDSDIADTAAFVLENSWTAPPEDFRDWNYVNHIAAKILGDPPEAASDTQLCRSAGKDFP